MIRICSLIKFHRRHAGLSQLELAEMAGVSRKVVQSVEAGQDGISWRNLCAILTLLNVDLEPSGPLVETWREEEPRSETGDEGDS